MLGAASFTSLLGCLPVYFCCWSGVGSAAATSLLLLGKRGWRVKFLWHVCFAACQLCVVCASDCCFLPVALRPVFFGFVLCVRVFFHGGVDAPNFTQHKYDDTLASKVIFRQDECRKRLEQRARARSDPSRILVRAVRNLLVGYDTPPAPRPLLPATFSRWPS